MMETLSDFTKWTTYEPLGSRSVSSGRGGRPVVADLSDEYRVAFSRRVGARRHGTVKFEKLQLQRCAASPRTDRASRSRSLHRRAWSSSPELQSWVAASDPRTPNRALFLALQARAR